MSKELIEQINEIKDCIEKSYRDLEVIRDSTSTKTKVFCNESRKKLSELLVIINYYKDAVIYENRHDELNLELTLKVISK